MLNYILNCKKSLVICVLILTCCTYNQLVGQDTLSSLSINSKYGRYLSSYYRSGYTFGFELQAKYKKWFYALEYLEFQETELLWVEPYENHHAISGLVGKSFGDGFLKVQLQSGLTGMFGLVRTNKGLSGGSLWGGGTYESKKYVSVGVPVRIGLKCVPFRFMALGVELQGIASTQHSFFFPMLSLELGLLRKRIRFQEVLEKINLK
jgi:hypothetical protein